MLRSGDRPNGAGRVSHCGSPWPSSPSRLPPEQTVLSPTRQQLGEPEQWSELIHQSKVALLCFTGNSNRLQL